MPEVHGLRRARQVAGLRVFLLRGEVFPEVGDEERAVRALQCVFQTGLVVEVGRDDFRASSRKCAGFLAIDVARDGADAEPAVRIIEDGAPNGWNRAKSTILLAPLPSTA